MDVVLLEHLLLRHLLIHLLGQVLLRLSGVLRVRSCCAIVALSDISNRVLHIDLLEALDLLVLLHHLMRLLETIDLGLSLGELLHCLKWN